MQSPSQARTPRSAPSTGTDDVGGPRLLSRIGRWLTRKPRRPDDPGGRRDGDGQRGTGGVARSSNPVSEQQQVERTLRRLLRDMAARDEARDDASSEWTPERLRNLMQERLAADEVIVVSNREPYVHELTENGIRYSRPAGGLITAVEPVMRACSGTWIAHGSGSADRDVSGPDGRIQVPPGKPSYTLRRVWLDDDELQGYYYGFANEGLWPLCHVAHVRPVFRSSDWACYQAVNRRFADAVIEEARTRDPIVLIQDYHFALAPAMIREALPDATIITFWHIPWPNFEAFGICPWKEALLEGLMGSDILGFHTTFHCKNFIETIERFIEARIEPESSTISIGSRRTHVEAYPISIAWPEDVDPAAFPAIRADVRARYGLPPEHHLAIGVDRLDYTKGIIERVHAVARMLEQHPEWIGRFSLLQIAAPSRSTLVEYQRFESDLIAAAEAVNQRFRRNGIDPILLRIELHGQDTVLAQFRAADVCLVTSLHDGMNLVSKEFVAAHDDEHGVLVLSEFAGAARELVDALIINPYHVDQIADALYEALTMDEIEQRLRMRSMRQIVRAFNVYRWAGQMLLDADKLRLRERLRAGFLKTTQGADGSAPDMTAPGTSARPDAPPRVDGGGPGLPPRRAA